MIHQQLVPLLTNSSADFILCADKELKPVVNKVKRKNIIWYKDIQVLLNDLCSILTPNSITLMKSSITGTNFPEVAKKLPCMIEQGYIKESSIFYDKNLVHPLHLYLRMNLLKMSCFRIAKLLNV
ncbi:hypothetical protein MTQ93_12105 [Staphylococcus agnetis]|uniref:hypothetical protein n=1 Tax=Staphylococcus agnetis TaxID=985762 RepID=UPI00208EABB9|nr:hypothetical protein [Staphylococcus agnetis]MCO4346773.1 hypothetical protein [Staphylococcus agnetis]